MTMSSGFTLVMQVISAAVAVSTLLGLLYWSLEHPALQDEEMGSILEQVRSIRERADAHSRRLAMDESDRLYR